MPKPNHKPRERRKAIRDVVFETLEGDRYPIGEVLSINATPHPTTPRCAILTGDVMTAQDLSTDLVGRLTCHVVDPQTGEASVDPTDLGIWRVSDRPLIHNGHGEDATMTIQLVKVVEQAEPVVGRASSCVWAGEPVGDIDPPVVIHPDPAPPAPTPGPAPDPEPAPQPAPPADPLAATRQTVVGAHNRYRAQHNLTPYRLNDTLCRASQGHADHMAKIHLLSHFGIGDGTPWSRMQAAGYKFDAAGENIGEGQRDPQEITDAFMSDWGHRANVLGAYVDIGVGIAETSGGTKYWVCDYGRGE